MISTVEPKDAKDASGISKPEGRGPDTLPAQVTKDGKRLKLHQFQ